MSPAGRIGKVWPPDHGRWPPGEARCFIDMPLNTSPPTANVAALAALAEKRRCAEAAVLRAGMKRAAACGRVVAVHGEDRELTRRLAAEASAAGEGGGAGAECVASGGSAATASAGGRRGDVGAGSKGAAALA